MDNDRMSFYHVRVCPLEVIRQVNGGWSERSKWPGRQERKNRPFSGGAISLRLPRIAAHQPQLIYSAYRGIKRGLVIYPIWKSLKRKNYGRPAGTMTIEL